MWGGLSPRALDHARVERKVRFRECNDRNVFLQNRIQHPGKASIRYANGETLGNLENATTRIKWSRNARAAVVEDGRRRKGPEKYACQNAWTIQAQKSDSGQLCSWGLPGRQPIYKVVQGSQGKGHGTVRKLRGGWEHECGARIGQSDSSRKEGIHNVQRPGSSIPHQQACGFGYRERIGIGGGTRGTCPTESPACGH